MRVEQSTHTHNPHSPPHETRSRASREATARDSADTAALAGLGAPPGGAGRILLVSNRGPVEHHFGADGAPEPQRGAGGVVSGLIAALGGRPATWISLAMTDADRAVAASGRAVHAPDSPDALDLRLVDVSPAAYKRHYDGISNKVLWFAQHYLLTPGSARPWAKRLAADWERGYVAVNDAVADAVLAELDARGADAPVLFQDYHLYLAPERVRAARPEARLAQFIHIPWPEARYWDLLPDYMVRAIFRGLAANDVIGFQTQRDARNFLDGATRFLDGAEVRPDGPGAMRVLCWHGRRILARAYPIAVTPAEVRASAATPAARRAYRALTARLSDDHRLIVRVDRVEPTKNIVAGFEAYERLLEEHPEYHQRVTFLALLVPSRQGMAEYRAYERQVRAAIERVNQRFAQPGWQPIRAVFGNHRARALACMRRYDVLLVNPLIDGMNLVVKEGGLVNERDGVTVLSRTAGAYEQLHPYVLGIAPTDVMGTAEALHAALTMPKAQRAARAKGLRAQLESEDARLWLAAQMRDLARLTRRELAARAPTAVPRPAALPSVARPALAKHPRPAVAVLAASPRPSVRLAGLTTPGLPILPHLDEDPLAETS